MDFRKKLALGHSKLFTNEMAKEIISHPSKMDDLIEIFVEGPVQYTQRAAWVISVVAERRPKLLEKYYPLFIKLLNEPGKHDAVNRNIMRAFQFVDIPKKHQGEILDVAFRLLNSSSEPIAVKAFSMTVIYNLSIRYPDIKQELKASIEALLPDGSAGIKSRGNRILKKLG